MNETVESPCLKGLTEDCFRHDPQWAKQAFAYRLIHLFCPKALTRRLPKGVRQALVYPGVALPPGVDLPPGLVIPPGASFPPGWSPGDPLPPGVTETPTPPGGTAGTGTTPPTYAPPFEPGPPHPYQGTNPPPAPGWYNYTDNTYWESYYGLSPPTWDGTKWVLSQDSEDKLKPIGAWKVGFRPTLMRLTLSPTSLTLKTIYLYDAGFNTIAQADDYTNKEEITITWDVDDIEMLQIYTYATPSAVSKIEFSAT